MQFLNNDIIYYSFVINKKKDIQTLCEKVMWNKQLLHFGLNHIRPILVK